MNIREVMHLRRFRTKRQMDTSAPYAFSAQRWMLTEALVLAAMGTAMLGACFSPLPSWIGQCCAGPSGEPPTATAAGLLCTYGVGLLLVGALSLCTAHKRSHTITMAIVRMGVDVWQEFIQAARAALRVTRGTEWAGCAVLLLMAGALLRGYGISLPVRYDEAFTYLHFVEGGALVPFHYLIPNNHVLYSLLVKAVAAILGGDPWVLRLPAFVAGMGALVMAVAVARRLLGPASGLTTLSLMAMHPYLVLYDTMGRGYSLTVLMGLCLVGAGLRFVERPQLARGALVALIAAVGHLVMPSFLFASGGALLWISLMLLRRHMAPYALLGWLAWLTALTALFTLVLYTPVLLVSHGVDSILNNRWTATQSWSVLVWRLPNHVRAVWRTYTLGVPPLLVAGCACGLVLGVLRLVKARNWVSVALLPAFVVAAVVLVCAKRAVPFPRTWLFALPFAFLLIDAAVSSATSSLSGAARKRVHVGVAMVALAWGAMTIRDSVLTQYPNLGYVAEMPAAADWIMARFQPGDRVDAGNRVDAPLRYYMTRHNRRPTTLEGQPHARIFFVTHVSVSPDDKIESPPDVTFGPLAIRVLKEDIGMAGGSGGNASDGGDADGSPFSP